MCWPVLSPVDLGSRERAVYDDMRDRVRISHMGRDDAPEAERAYMSSLIGRSNFGKGDHGFQRPINAPSHNQ
jgi:hypothetical protein